MYSPSWYKTPDFTKSTILSIFIVSTTNQFKTLNRLACVSKALFCFVTQYFIFVRIISADFDYFKLKWLKPFFNRFNRKLHALLTNRKVIVSAGFI